MASFNFDGFANSLAKADIDFELSNVTSEMKVRQRNFRSV